MSKEDKGYIKKKEPRKDKKSKKGRKKHQSEKSKGFKKKLSEKKKVIAFFTILIFAGTATTFAVIEMVRAQNRIILATTTSTYDSGLLDTLIPTFESQYGIEVEVLSVGTGQAIETAKRGDADVLFVHSRASEDLFVSDGYGVHRACVMYNDFIIVGPSTDPAGILGDNITTAMTKLKSAGSAGTIKFYSRGDTSGTHSKELILWSQIGFTPNTATNTWYLETGSGMGTTLTVTNQNGGYTLVDRGTWLSYKASLSLSLFVEGDMIMLNPYGAILVNQTLYPHTKYEKALKFVAFLISQQGQTLIATYKKNNEVLFHPAFGQCNNTHNCTTRNEEVAFWKTYNGGYIGPAATVPSFLHNSISHVTSITISCL